MKRILFFLLLALGLASLNAQTFRFNDGMPEGWRGQEWGWSSDLGAIYCLTSYLYPGQNDTLKTQPFTTFRHYAKFWLQFEAASYNESYSTPGLSAFTVGVMAYRYGVPTVKELGLYGPSVNSYDYYLFDITDSVSNLPLCDSVVFYFVYNGAYGNPTTALLIDNLSYMVVDTSCGGPTHVSDYPYTQDFERAVPCYSAYGPNSIWDHYYFTGNSGTISLVSYDTTAGVEPDTWLVTTPYLTFDETNETDSIRITWYDAALYDGYNQQQYSVYLLHDTNYSSYEDIATRGVQIFQSDTVGNGFTQRSLTWPALGFDTFYIAFHHTGGETLKGSGMLIDDITVDRSHSYIFYANDGTGRYLYQSYWVEDTVIYPQCPYEREGYTFIGWNDYGTDIVDWTAIGLPGTEVVTNYSEALYAAWHRIDTVRIYPYTQALDSMNIDWYATYDDPKNDRPSYSVGVVYSADPVYYSLHFMVGSSLRHWLVSPAFQLPVADTITLSYLVGGLSVLSSCDDTVSLQHLVLLSTENDSLHHFTTTLMDDTTKSDTLKMRNIDLSAYAGQIVYIAFPHTAPSDTSYSYIMIDSVMIGYGCAEHRDTIEMSVCGQYQWGGRMLTAEGYYDSITPLGACDSITTLHLTLSNEVLVDSALTVCDSFLFAGAYRTVSGVYGDTTALNPTCDSILRLALTVNHSNASMVDTAFCDSVLFRGAKYYATTNVDVPAGKTVLLCDSTVHYTLTLHTSTTSVRDTDFCDSVRFHGVFYDDNASVLLPVGMNAQQCDSAVRYNLNVRYASSSMRDTFFCDSILFHGEHYYGDKNVEVLVGKNIYQCDSTVGYRLEVHHSTASDSTVDFCDTITFHGNNYQASDVVVLPAGKNAQQCDSVDRYTLTRYTAQSSHDTAMACDAYDWHGTHYNTPGLKYDTVRNAVHGVCDSFYTLGLSLADTMRITDSASACDTYRWLRNGVQYSATTTVSMRQTAATVAECDTIYTLKLTINGSILENVETEECDTLLWQGRIYTASARDTVHFTSAAGCDSSLALNAVIHHSVSNTVDTAACGSVVWQGTTYRASTQLSDNLYTIHLCDSLVTVNINVKPIAQSTADSSACDSLLWQGRYYTNSQIMPFTLRAANGCDSNVVMRLHVMRTGTRDTAATACDAYMWRGTLRHDAINTVTMHNAGGCDSTITLHLTLHPSYHLQHNDVACDRYQWQGMSYTASGVYSSNYRTAYGCDSIITLALTVNYTFRDTIEATTADTMLWEGRKYFMPGYYSNSDRGYATAAGCDSIWILSLTVTGFEGVNSADEVRLNVYPNPTAGMLHIDADGLTSVRLYSLNGRCLYQSNTAEPLDLAPLPHGVYLLRVETTHGAAVERIVRQ